MHKEASGVNFNSIFCLIQCIQNIISINININAEYFISLFFFLVPSSNSRVYVTLTVHLTSNWAHFQVPNSPMWLVATVLDGAALDQYPTLVYLEKCTHDTELLGEEGLFQEKVMQVFCRYSQC